MRGSERTGLAGAAERVDATTGSTWRVKDGEVSGESARLRLRTARSSVARSIHALLTSPDAEQFHGKTVWTLDDTRMWMLSGARQDLRDGRRSFRLTVRTPESRTLLGAAEFELDSSLCPFGDVRRASLGYLVRDRARNKGYAVEMVRSLLDLAFDHLGVAEIHASVHPHNAASLRVLQKAGMYVFRYFFPCAELGRKDHRLLCNVTADEWRDGRSGPRSRVKGIGLFPWGARSANG
jgi:ribosomal-protein-alanine N-acetyltransferase